MVNKLHITSVMLFLQSMTYLKYVKKNIFLPLNKIIRSMFLIVKYLSTKIFIEIFFYVIQIISKFNQQTLYSRTQTRTKIIRISASIPRKNNHD